MLLDSAFDVADACPDTAPDTSTAVDDTAVDDARSDSVVDDTDNDTSDRLMIPQEMIQMMTESMLLHEVVVVSSLGAIIPCILILIVDQLNCTVFIE